MRALLRSKNIEQKGLKPDHAEAVAWSFTKERLARQQPALAALALLVSRPSQPTVRDFFRSA